MPEFSVGEFLLQRYSVRFSALVMRYSSKDIILIFNTLFFTTSLACSLRDVSRVICSYTQLLMASRVFFFYRGAALSHFFRLKFNDTQDGSSFSSRANLTREYRTG